jgi:hypothetical protein
LAALINLHLSADIHAYDSNEIEINGLRDAIEDTFEKAEEMDNDDEKKIRRQYELLKQGDVFVETVWDEKFIKDKKLKGSKTFDRTIKGVSWTTKLKRLYAQVSTSTECHQQKSRPLHCWISKSLGRVVEKQLAAGDIRTSCADYKPNIFDAE